MKKINPLSLVSWRAKFYLVTNGFAMKNVTSPHSTLTPSHAMALTSSIFSFFLKPSCENTLDTESEFFTLPIASCEELFLLVKEGEMIAHVRHNFFNSCCKYAGEGNHVFVYSI